ncbi:hypothetical protein [Amycolatopsis sp. NBC_00438]|uniref:hypothetical protein n=1 Tax=Amycolatopsis sp. NBC_00438 TaxID=2903558 RepID=UPI002E1ACF10
MIVPETIVVEHGRVFVPAAFTAACAKLGITLQPARKRNPTDKPHVESGFWRVANVINRCR